MFSAGISMVGGSGDGGDTTINQTINQSINTAVIFSGNSNKFKNRYLFFENQPSNINGYTVLFPSTISKINVSVFSLSTGNIIIRKNNIILTTISLSNETQKLIEGLTYPLILNDKLNIYVESVIGISYPRVQIYIN